VHFVGGGTEVQRTPSLVETQVADNVRNVVASNRVAGEAAHAVGTGRKGGCAERTKEHSRGIDQTRRVA
jgi:hypothetical protein